MQMRNVRVVLASEHPGVRHFLSDTVRKERGAVVVGQAENAANALTLTRKLRPDVAILDCHLPHTAGFDSVRLSRAGGLDTAQSISAEVPNTRVVLLNGLDAALPETASGPDVAAGFSRETGGSYIPFTLNSLVTETPADLVFASVEVREQVPRHRKAAELGDNVLGIGTLGIIFGLGMVVTGILAVPGLFVLSAGAAAVSLALLGKVALRHIVGNDKR